MKHKIRLAILSLTAALSISGSAQAWDCIAVSEEGTYGYSYDYGDRGDAAERALNECADRTTSDGTCELVECEDN